MPRAIAPVPRLPSSDPYEAVATAAMCWLPLHHAFASQAPLVLIRPSLSKPAWG